MNKKILSAAICSFALCAFATESTSPTPSIPASSNPMTSAPEVPSPSRASARIIYKGPAYYPQPGDGLYPRPAKTVRVVWTSSECSVNGEDGYQPQMITGGGFPFNLGGGNIKYMNYRVNYEGDYYYFQAN